MEIDTWPRIPAYPEIEADGRVAADAPFFDEEGGG